MASSVSAKVGGVLRRGQRRWSRSLERLTLPSFATEAPGFEMRLPRTLAHPERMRIGRDVKIGPNSELKCQIAYPGGWMRHPDGTHVEQRFDPCLTIGDRVTATRSLQVLVFDSVTIEDDVMFAGNVFVADGTHALATAEVPFKYQGVGRVAPIRIGRGSWIGQNVVIMPGVSIGAHAIVGANSVVTRDVPAQAIAVGAPARVVRTWDQVSSTWQRGFDREGT